MQGTPSRRTVDRACAWHTTRTAHHARASTHKQTGDGKKMDSVRAQTNAKVAQSLGQTRRRHTHVFLLVVGIERRANGVQVCVACCRVHTQVCVCVCVVRTPVELATIACAPAHPPQEVARHLGVHASKQQQTLLHSKQQQTQLRGHAICAQPTVTPGVCTRSPLNTRSQDTDADIRAFSTGILDLNQHMDARNTCNIHAYNIHACNIHAPNAHTRASWGQEHLWKG